MNTVTNRMITETEGDLFDAPDGAVLIHSCNCMGSWGKGIARAFKEKYPAAFEVYRAHCQDLLSNPKYATLPATESTSGETVKARRVQLPAGTALIIPPQARDYLPRPSRRTGQGPAGVAAQTERKKKHWIVCLFTSRNFGRNVSSSDVILANTKAAVEDMKRQLVELQDDAEAKRQRPDKGAEEESEGLLERPGELWSCRFNSGLFAVDWKLSRKILEDAVLTVTVVRPLEE